LHFPFPRIALVFSLLLYFFIISVFSFLSSKSSEKSYVGETLHTLISSYPGNTLLVTQFFISSAIFVPFADFGKFSINIVYFDTQAEWSSLTTASSAMIFLNI